MRNSQLDRKGEYTGINAPVSDLLMASSVVDMAALLTIIFAIRIRGGKRAWHRQTNSMVKTLSEDYAARIVLLLCLGFGPANITPTSADALDRSDQLDEANSLPTHHHSGHFACPVSYSGD